MRCVEQVLKWLPRYLFTHPCPEDMLNARLNSIRLFAVYMSVNSDQISYTYLGIALFHPINAAIFKMRRF